jgi:uncharacterized membrane protein YphA (DoxX/SURF4 family)
MALRRLASIALLTCFLALGTGSAQYLHFLDHQGDDLAAHLKPASNGEHRSDRHHQPRHDESRCAIHAILRAPVASVGWVPLLVSLGLLIGFLTLLPSTPFVPQTIVRIDCRGPPVC